MTNKPDIRVIGIGSHHGADAIGWLACEKLQRRMALERIDWQLCRTPAQLPQLILDYHGVVILDAVLNEQPLGEVLTLTWPDQQDISHSPPSSHGLSVIEALQLTAALGQLPSHTYILGISINQRQQAASLALANALPQLQQQLIHLHNIIVLSHSPDKCA